MVLDLFVGISVAALAIAQASQVRDPAGAVHNHLCPAPATLQCSSLADLYQVARNVTTNELANWHRYKYAEPASVPVGSHWG